MARKKKHTFCLSRAIGCIFGIIFGIAIKVGFALLLNFYNYTTKFLFFSPATIIFDVLIIGVIFELNYRGSYIVIDSENKIIKRKGLFWGFRKTIQFSDIQEIKFYKSPAPRYGKDCIVLLDAESDESRWFTKYAPIRLEWTTKTVDFLKNEAEEIYERVITDTTIPEPED